MFLRSTFINLPRIAQRNVVRTCTHEVTSQPTQPTSSDWHTIYSLPLVGSFARISKLKVYQGGITVLGAPVGYGLQSMDIFSSPTAELFTVLGKPLIPSMLQRNVY